MDDPKFRRAVEVAARELHDQCREAHDRDWAHRRPADQAAYRRIARQMLLAVMAEQRTKVGAR